VIVPHWLKEHFRGRRLAVQAEKQHGLSAGGVKTLKQLHLRRYSPEDCHTGGKRQYKHPGFKLQEWCLKFYQIICTR
jgi:hypothetical protein